MAVWDRQPNETQNAWNAFVVYRELPVHSLDGATRSLKNASDKLGHSQMATVEKWSAKYGWVDRVAAYDAHMASSLVTIKEVALEELQQSVVVNLQEQLIASHRLIQKRLRELVEEDEVSAIEIQRMLTAMKIQDDLARRAAQLPTNYRSETTEDLRDDAVYVIEG